MQFIGYLFSMNKTALITGAAKRIGRSIAEHLAHQGWDVIVHYNSSGEEADKLVDELISKYPGQRFRPVQANLFKIEEVENLIPKVVKKNGTFSLLINNASVFDPANMEETSSSLLEKQIGINFKAPFLLMRDFKKYCNEGNIINITDTRISNNRSAYAAYSLSKKVLWESTKMAALEFAPDIRVNAVAPGVTLAPAGKGDDYLWQLAQRIPMRKPGGMEPVLKSIDFILDNPYLTGHLLFADGGENLGLSDEYSDSK